MTTILYIKPSWKIWRTMDTWSARNTHSRTDAPNESCRTLLRLRVWTSPSRTDLIGKADKDHFKSLMTLQSLGSEVSAKRQRDWVTWRCWSTLQKGALLNDRLNLRVTEATCAVWFTWLRATRRLPCWALHLARGLWIASNTFCKNSERRW